MIAVLGVAGFLASAGAAFAQTTVGAPTQATTAAPAAAAEKAVLQVGPKGVVLLRGTIDSVSSGTVTVKSWGGDWTVNVPSAAEVLPNGVALSDYKQGDFVGVQGTVDSSANWTVNAKLIRDWTARQAAVQEAKANVQLARTTMAQRARTIQGKLSGLDATAGTFTLTDAAGTAYSVTLNTGAETINGKWATITLAQANEGDTVRVYGTVSSTTIAASVFRDVSVK